MDIAPEKIIVIDSDPAASAELQDALRTAGYDAAAFATSREGLDAIHQHGAEIVILDSRIQGEQDEVAVSPSTRDSRFVVRVHFL